jgi:iron complex transport system substrate-binding protein
VYGKVGSIVLRFALLAALSACSTTAQPARHATGAPRIVTLMPVFAQDLCALGAGAQLAGVSQYSEDARCARGLPQVNDFASVDTEKIISLHPDFVVAIPAQRTLTVALARAGVRVVYLPDDSFHDIFSNVYALGRLSRHDPSSLVARLRERTRALQASEHFTKRMRVFVALQAQPIWTVGPQSYISTLLQLAGARNAVTALPRAYAQYSAEALIRLQPDAIVTSSDTHLADLFGREPWRSLRAVRDGHVFVLGDASLLETPGPSYNEGLAWLIERLRSLSP